MYFLNSYDLLNAMFESNLDVEINYDVEVQMWNL